MYMVVPIQVLVGVAVDGFVRTVDMDVRMDVAVLVGVRDPAVAVGVGMGMDMLVGML